MAPRVRHWTSSGLPGSGSADVVQILAPAGTPQQIVNRLNSEISQVVAQPAAKDQLLKMASKDRLEYARVGIRGVPRGRYRAMEKIARDPELKAE